VVLGDRFGAAASPAIARRLQTELEDLGLRVVRNAPYAGGYTTETYGRPSAGIHALQIEINRALYLDEAALTPGPGYAALRDTLSTLIGRLAAADWTQA
jgi:N-formylglutamate amidohydrolase